MMKFLERDERRALKFETYIRGFEQMPTFVGDRNSTISGDRNSTIPGDKNLIISGDNNITP